MTDVPKKILLLGAGGVGSTLARFLVDGKYDVTVVDQEVTTQTKLPHNVEFITLDLNDNKNDVVLETLVSQHDLVLAAVTYDAILKAGKIAAKYGTHFVAPTESTEIDNQVQALASESLRLGHAACFSPQCGVSPGHSSVVTRLMTEDLTRIDRINIRVGALQQKPSGELNHGDTWSPESMLMEYLELVEAYENGQYQLKDPIGADREDVYVINDQTLYARDTAGGLASTVRKLMDEQPSRIHVTSEINYKSLRFAGHWEKVEELLAEAREEFVFDNDTSLHELCALMCNRDYRDTVKKVSPETEPLLYRNRVKMREWTEDEFVKRIGTGWTREDQVVVRIEVEGVDGSGRDVNRMFTDVTKPLSIGGKEFTAIEATTAAGIYSGVKLILDGEQKAGYVGQSDFDPAKYYASAPAKAVYGGINRIRELIKTTYPNIVKPQIPDSVKVGQEGGAERSAA